MYVLSRNLEKIEKDIQVLDQSQNLIGCYLSQVSYDTQEADKYSSTTLWGNGA